MVILLGLQNGSVNWLGNFVLSMINLTCFKLEAFQMAQIVRETFFRRYDKTKFFRSFTFVQWGSNSKHVFYVCGIKRPLFFQYTLPCLFIDTTSFTFYTH